MKSNNTLTEIGNIAFAFAFIVLAAALGYRGSAQTNTMTAIMTHATRFPAASPVQITMSPTIVIASAAKP
jgi:hypothetical protein